MNSTIKEIMNNKNLEINIPKFGKGLMTIFNSYSFIRLSMNYYTYYEIINESDKNDTILESFIERFNKIIKYGVIGPVMGETQEKVLKDVVEVRNEVIDLMKGLTCLADIFNIYEYVLNRIEYNYKDSSYIEKLSDADFTTTVISYILSDKDNVVMNTKISETVRELPVRLTKAKFFEMLHTGMLVYKGSEKQSVDDFLYMLRTSTMLDIVPSAFNLSEDIKDIYEEFKNVDFSNINEEQYTDLSAKLKFATDFIEDTVNKYMIFAEVLNDAYVIVLSNHYVEELPLERPACTMIIETLYNRFTKDKLADDVEVENIFFQLEGKQEAYHRQYSNMLSTLEYLLDSKKELIGSLVLDTMYNSLEIISKLVSGSIFVEFDTETNSEEADIEYIDSKFEVLRADFTEFFKNNKKPVNRAVMAQVLSALPIFFNNVDEIKDYIVQSIGQCSDEAEKLACYEIFHSLMEE